jgi:hypothetical protein
MTDCLFSIAEDQCVGSVAWTSYGSAIRMPSYDDSAGQTIFKITKLATNITSLGSLQVCFQLRSPCSTLSELCSGGACETALLNTPNNCCPITQLPTSL